MRGTIIPTSKEYKDYLAGRKSGIYWSIPPPTYQKKNDINNKKKTDYLNIMSEVFRQRIRQKTGIPNLTNNSKLF